MKTVLTALLATGALVATAASVPARAGEGAGDPFALPNTGVNSQMSMTRGGNTDPFKWSTRPTASQYSETRGGNTDPFKWSTSPVPAPSATHRADVTAPRSGG